MNIWSVWILVGIAILVFLAARYSFRHRGSCSACGGCSSRDGSCASCRAVNDLKKFAEEKRREAPDGVQNKI